MTELLEGPWKNFTFKMIKQEDYPKILSHMRKNFMVDEPLCKLLKYTEEELEEMDELLVSVMDKGISFFAMDNATGDVAGVRLTSIELRSDKDKKFPEPRNPRMKIVIGFFDTLTEGEGCVFSRYPDVDKLANFFMASVDKKYRGEGLATEMYKRSLKFFQKAGVPVAKSNFSSPYTRKAATNLGFVELKRLRFLDYKDPEGRLYLPEATDDQMCSCMALRMF